MFLLDKAKKANAIKLFKIFLYFGVILNSVSCIDIFSNQFTFNYPYNFTISSSWDMNKLHIPNQFIGTWEWRSYNGSSYNVHTSWKITSDNIQMFNSEMTIDDLNSELRKIGWSSNLKRAEFSITENEILIKRFYKFSSNDSETFSNYSFKLSDGGSILYYKVDFDPLDISNPGLILEKR